VLSKIENVLEELRVNVNRYNLHEMKSSITTLPQTLKEADGIILAASVEWHGIGGYMHEFLDACWLYGDKEKISKIYMAPVIISTTYGEKEALTDIKSAWELLGGMPCSGICAYVQESVDFEMNKEYAQIIERKAENLYRTISQKRKALPSSSYAIRQNLIKDTLDLTPQETEQLSKYASNDTYVKKQKEDIEELASMFKGMLSSNNSDFEDDYIKSFTSCFTPQEGFSATYTFIIDDKNKNLLVAVNDDDIECKYEKKSDVDVLAKLSSESMQNILKGRLTFQRAFMTGEMTARGNFKTLRVLDELFPFSDK
jgi:multimeric flavodoxin WrbA